MRLWIYKRRFEIAALVAGLALRALFVWKHARFDGDTLIYGDLAQNMLTHHVYGLTENVVRPTLIRLPGYPLFLAACFVVFGKANYLAVLWVQVAVGLATCWLIAKLAERMFGERVGMAALWLACLCPFTANYDAAALAETLSLFYVVAAFFSLERWEAARRLGERGWGWVVCVGAALSYAVLLRPEQGLLAASVVPAMVWMEWRRTIVPAQARSGPFPFGKLRVRMTIQGARPAVVASLLVGLPLVVWAGRNWRVFHVVQPLAPKYANDPGEFVSYGFARWYRTWGVEYASTVNTYWVWDGGVMKVSDLPARAMDSAMQRAQTEQAYAAYNVGTTATTATDAAFGRIAAERVVAGRWRYYVAMPLAREADMWLRPRTEFMKLPLEWWRFREHVGASLICLAYAGLDWVLLGLAAVGIRRVRWSGVTAAMMGFVGLRCLLLLTLDNAEPRYTLECFPVVILLAAVVVAREKKASLGAG